MTATQDRPLTAVPDEKKRPAAQLELGPPPEWAEASVPIAQIRVEDFGTPPSGELLRAVNVHGVLVPVLLDGSKQDGYRVIDGRRRVLAAIECEIEAVPARVLKAGEPAMLDPALTLATNDAASANPIVEFEAIEELMAAAGGSLTLPAIANAVGVKLKTLRARMKLSALCHELRDGWKDGKFGTKVGEACARLNADQQREVVRRLEATGTVTMDDVKAAKRVGVESHERTLPADNTVKRAIAELGKIRGELFLALGKCDALEALDDAIAALEEEA